MSSLLTHFSILVQGIIKVMYWKGKKNTHTHKGALPKKMQDVSSKNIGTLDIFPRRPQKNQKLI